jgi:hypothetical protein
MVENLTTMSRRQLGYVFDDFKSRPCQAQGRDHPAGIW